MFRRLKELRRRSVFNAENCIYKQNKMFIYSVQNKIEDIEARIKFVVESTPEHEVIYCMRPFEEPIFEIVEQHFKDLGFKVIVTDIEGLPNKHMIISWYE